jgi:cell division protein FtsQ
VTATRTQKAKRPAIDPRIKQRRIEETRRQGRRRLRVLLILLGVVLVISAAGAATRSPLLDVDHVEVTGAKHTPVADVIAAAELRRGRLMIDVDAGAARHVVARLAWVGDVRVERHWPNTVRIALRERVPVASIPAKGGGWVIADRKGRVLAHQSQPMPGLPQVTGGLPAGLPGTLVSRPVIAALEVAAAMPQELRSKASAVAIVADGLDLALVSKGVAKLGSTDQLTAKLDAVLTMLAKANLTNLSVLDVRVPGAPVLTRG